MCDLVAASVAMALFTGVGTMMDASMQADTERQNAALAEKNAKEVEVLGAISAYDFKQQGKQQVGAQKAAMVAAGIDLGGESSIDFAFRNQQTIESDALKMQLSTDIEAENYKFEAKSRRDNANKMITRGFVGATSSFLSAGVRSKWGALK